MKKSDLFLMALKNLKDRKTRTRLTVIGVVIGTCAIVIMVSIGVGIDKMLTSQLQSSSTLNKITVYNYRDIASTENGEESLPFDDRAVEYFKGIEHVTDVYPVLNIDSQVNITRGKYTLTWGIKAVDLDLMEKLGYTLTEGSFSNIDKKNTVFFGKSAVTNFMDPRGNTVKFSYNKDNEIVDCEIDAMKDVFYASPLARDENGKPIKISNDMKKRLRVGGVLKQDNKIDYNSGYGVYMDISLAKELVSQYQKISGGKKEDVQYSEINILVDEMKNVDFVKSQLTAAGFTSSAPDDELDYVKKVMAVVQLVLGAIGAISMFVAMFGISNTMVMSVYERTKEIGIMKVLGCDLKDIKAVFLYEAGTIGLLGGGIGLAISYTISIIANLVARLVVDKVAGGEIDFEVCVSSIPPWLAIAGIAFSVGVGVIAGLSPAKKSVKVSALTAIHNE